MAKWRTARQSIGARPWIAEQQPPLAVAGLLKAIISGEDAPIEEALRLEREAVHKTMGSKHQLEGMKAFMQKRTLDFSSEPF